MTIKQNKKPGICAVLAAVILAYTLAPGALALEDKPRELVPMGCTVGIQMQTRGVIVVGLSELETPGGGISPAGEAGVLPGDVIVKLGGRDIESSNDFLEAVAALDGTDVSITIMRGGKAQQLTVTPAMGDSGEFQLGLWLRDSVSGIGTVTFYDPLTGLYGALGHPISDVDTGVIMPVSSGSILKSTVVDVKRGESGEPGELRGVFDESEQRGSIMMNTPCGIFGIMYADDESAIGEAIPVADESEIELGGATVYSNVDGSEVREYAVEITRVYRNDEAGRSMMISVTDPELLEKTGGIVQGMSGSPVIQNGKLVGAVTHVLVNDPTRGYGISVDDMLEASGNEDETAALAA